jgi:hypothetical protein
MSHFEALDRELNQMILEGKGMEAFEKFYADDCVMHEPGMPPCIGKAANRKREHDFLEMVEAVHDGKLVASALGDGVSFSEWRFEMTLKGMPRQTMEQVARRTWKDGRIVDERFYYHRG